MCMYVCMHKHARLGGSECMLPPRKCLEIRCSEIASEAILRQNIRAVMATWLAEYCQTTYDCLFSYYNQYSQPTPYNHRMMVL